MTSESVRDDNLWVPAEEAYERLELLTGRSRQHVQQDIRDKLYPVKPAPGGGRLINIPAHAPETLSVQLAKERERCSTLKAERDALRAQAEELAQQVRGLGTDNAELTETVAELRAQVVDEITYRAYLTVTIRMLGAGQSTGLTKPSSPPAETVNLIPPAEGTAEVDPEIMLRDGRTITIDSRILGALRTYVAEYARVHGRATFVADFHISPAVLHRWEAGHTTFMIPVRVLEHLGADPEAIMGAAGVLRAMASGVAAGSQEGVSYDPNEGWEHVRSDEAPRVVSIRPLVSDEAAAYGERAAWLIDWWRNSRTLVFDTARGPLSGLPREIEIGQRRNLLDIELELIRDHGMTIMGGGSGHWLDQAMWDEDGTQAEIRWREIMLEDVRRQLAYERRRWHRRLIDFLVG